MWAALAVGAAISFTSGQSSAAFGQATCNFFGFSPAIPTNLGAVEFTKKSTSPAGGTTDMTLYNVNTKSFWTLRVNPNVVVLKPSFGFFETETSYDHLDVQELQPGGTNHVYTGLLNSSTTSLVQSSDLWSTNASGTGAPGELAISWTSDYSVANFAPPTIAAVSPQCTSDDQLTATYAQTIPSNSRNDGILLATGDTLYYQVTQPANTPMIVSLDTFTAGVDFDLYANFNSSLPDNSNFALRGFSGLANEAFKIPATGSSRIISIGVHSFSGAGHFVLHAYEYNDNSLNRACVNNSTISGTNLQTLKDFLAAGSANLFGMTNGNLWRSNYTITQNVSCGSDCDICVWNDSSTTSFGASGTNCGTIQLHGGNWSQGPSVAWLFAHESGHACYGMGDEYVPPPVGSNTTPRQCGHGIMANNGRATGFCSLAHCQDGQLSSSCDDGDSNWKYIKDQSDYTFYGENFDLFGETADPTPIWNNANLRALVTFN